MPLASTPAFVSPTLQRYHINVLRANFTFQGQVRKGYCWFRDYILDTSAYRSCRCRCGSCRGARARRLRLLRGCTHPRRNLWLRRCTERLPCGSSPHLSYRPLCVLDCSSTSEGDPSKTGNSIPSPLLSSYHLEIGHHHHVLVLQ